MNSYFICPLLMDADFRSVCQSKAIPFIERTTLPSSRRLCQHCCMSQWSVTCYFGFAFSLNCWNFRECVNPFGVKLGIVVRYTHLSPKLYLKYIYNQVLDLFNGRRACRPVVLKLTVLLWVHLLVRSITLDGCLLLLPTFWAFYERLSWLLLLIFLLAERSFLPIAWCTPPCLCSL